MSRTWESDLPAEVPVRQYMCSDQLAFFRERLERERRVLLSAAQATVAELQELAATPDPSDRASLEEDHALELRLRGRDLQQLQAIEQALSRLRDGTYGWCEQSGEPIGLARLVARPTATLSLAAQQQQESEARLKRARRF
jgi:DnaK suppressor protein